MHNSSIGMKIIAPKLKKGTKLTELQASSRKTSGEWYRGTVVKYVNKYYGNGIKFTSMQQVSYYY
jgi:hypothetical protein